MDYFKSFIIGSSVPIVAPFNYVVQNMKESTYDKRQYPIRASFYFGAMNATSKFIGDQLGWSLWKRLYVVNIISSLLIIFYNTFSMPEFFDFHTKGRWILHYLMIITGHSYAYLMAMHSIETLL